MARTTAGIFVLLNLRMGTASGSNLRVSLKWGPPVEADATILRDVDRGIANFEKVTSLFGFGTPSAEDLRVRDRCGCIVAWGF